MGENERSANYGSYYPKIQKIEQSEKALKVTCETLQIRLGAKQAAKANNNYNCCRNYATNIDWKRTNPQLGEKILQKRNVEREDI